MIYRTGPSIDSLKMPLSIDDKKHYFNETPPIYLEVIKYPHFSHYSYNDLKRYIKFEFALRTANIDENGNYLGYSHGKKYKAKDCTSNDFPPG